MYVFEEAGYMVAEQNGAEGQAAEVVRAEPFYAAEYRLEYVGDSVTDNVETAGNVVYAVTLDVYKGDVYVGQVTPSIQLDVRTQQRKLNAAVLTFPEEDLFVMYSGVNMQGDFSLDVRVNPLITPLWVGFGMLLLGMLAALVIPRSPSPRRDDDSRSAVL